MTRAKSIGLWTVSVLFMLAVAVFQKSTGPTYPAKGTLATDAGTVSFRLPRSHGGEGGQIVKVAVPDKTVRGVLKFKRYKSRDEWTEFEMFRDGELLSAEIPHQPPAGKVMYQVILRSGEADVPLTPNPVIIRFRGGVPAGVLIPHIVFVFLGMCFSTRAGLEAWLRGPSTFRMSLIACALLWIGGMTLGPIVQKYAFDAYWTGFPWGHDLTDNKMAASMAVWIAALWKQRKGREARGWVIAAALVLVATYAIPHSLLGSEIDYTC